jgi:putative Mg2+ transporter-C (MgtC) family protein
VDIGTWEIVARLAAAAGLGALIGLERDLRDEPAGLRTHALVSLGAALFTIAGAYGFQEFENDAGVDPARVAAQVATGIGFIGAGAILKIGVNVRGLTTAATLWLSAALGVAIGAGLFAAALIGAGCVILVVVGARLIRGAVRKDVLLAVEYRHGHGTLGWLILELERSGAEVGAVRLASEEDVEHGVRRVTVRVARPRDSELEHVLDEVRARPEVRLVELEHGD